MPQAHAFISYIRENSDAVDRLAGDLQANGVKVWLDRNDIMPGQYWKDAINDAIQSGAYFIACFSNELNERPETYMHGELRLAIERLRNMPRDRVWFISVLLNDTNIPSHTISDHETLADINTVRLFDDWNDGLRKIVRAMKLEDPEHRRILHLIDLIRYHPKERAYAIRQVAHIGNTAADALGEIGPAAAAAVLIEALLHDTNFFVRQSAAHVLGKIGPAAAAAVPALIEALHDDDRNVRRPAADVLGKIGPAAAAAVPVLIETLRDDDRNVRRKAAHALGKIDPAAAAADPALIEAPQDTNFFVRRSAADALKMPRCRSSRGFWVVHVEW